MVLLPIFIMTGPATVFSLDYTFSSTANVEVSYHSIFLKKEKKRKMKNCVDTFYLCVCIRAIWLGSFV
jgi:hypothetical protein